MSRFLLLFVFLFALLASTPFLAPVHAACDPGSTDTSGCITKGITDGNGGQSSKIDLFGGFGFATISDAVNTAIAVLFIGAGLLAFFYVLRGAAMYVMAGADAALVGKARTMMTNALIGLIIVASVYVIWLFAIHVVPGMSDFFGASGPDTNMPSDCSSTQNTAC